MGGGRPNVIGIAYVKVFDKSTLLITDNFMRQTIEDIEENNNVALVVWGKNWSGYKIIGKAKYYNKGK
jgi:predicted pyridoxine 5'-phosphate oxidase superfamily flavin-nucleotide-binding protein